MRLSVEIGKLAVGVNVVDDRRGEDALRLYAAYHGLAREGMNRRQVMRAALRQVLREVQAVAAAQFEEERREARRAEAVAATVLEVVEDEVEMPVMDEPVVAVEMKKGSR